MGRGRTSPAPDGRFRVVENVRWVFGGVHPYITKTTPGTSRALTIGTSTLMVKALLRSLLRKRIHVALVKAQPFA
jgi:hypothetical protein